MAEIVERASAEPGAPPADREARGARRTVGIGVALVVAGLVLVGAPFIEWWQQISAYGEITDGRTGFGRTAAGGSATGGWVLPSVADGIPVTAIGILVAVLGIVVAASRTRPAKAAILTSVAGVAVLAWTAASHLTFRADVENRAETSIFAAPDTSAPVGTGMVVAGVAALALVVLGALALRRAPHRRPG